MERFRRICWPILRSQYSKIAIFWCSDSYSASTLLYSPSTLPIQVREHFRIVRAHFCIVREHFCIVREHFHVKCEHTTQTMKAFRSHTINIYRLAFWTLVTVVGLHGNDGLIMSEVSRPQMINCTVERRRRRRKFLRCFLASKMIFNGAEGADFFVVDVCSHYMKCARTISGKSSVLALYVLAVYPDPECNADHESISGL